MSHKIPYKFIMLQDEDWSRSASKIFTIKIRKTHWDIK